MRLLLFSDLHCDAAAARDIVAQARDADILVGAGDFANCRRGLRVTIEVLRTVDRPAVLVPGNAESFEELAAACHDWPTARVLHGTGTEIDGVPFFGIGGAIPVTPFGAWSYDFTEAEAQTLLAACPAGAVLISHSPPRGCLDRDSAGRSLGSTTVRDAILACRPRLVVCGHIHASGGQSETFEGCAVVNAGPRGMVWACC